MSEIDTTRSEQPINARAIWATPEVVTMAAGDAENGAGPTVDDGVNKS